MAKSSKPEFDWKKLNEYCAGARDHIYMALIKAIDNAKDAKFTADDIKALVDQRYTK